MDDASQDSKSVDDISGDALVNGKVASPPQILDESANMPDSRDSERADEAPKDKDIQEEKEEELERMDVKQDEVEKMDEKPDEVEKMDDDSPGVADQTEENSAGKKYDPFSDEDASQASVTANGKDEAQDVPEPSTKKKKKSSRHKSSDKDKESKEAVDKEVVKAVDETSQDSTSKKDKSSKSWKDEMTAKHPKMVDLVKYWKPVKADPSDFQAWTYLLQYVDQENDVEAAQEVYETFLTRYPYCYGYWKKYADYMKKKAMKKDCELVFEMGLKAVPLSVDLWLHYLNYCKAHHSSRDEFIREQFEDAIRACGLEFRSDRLWELYINWELERDRLDRVFAIYDRLVRIPTQFHKTHWENFEDLVKQHSPRELLSATEFLALRKALLEDKKANPEADSDDAPPGDDVSEPPGSDASKKLSDDEMDAIKKKVRELRKDLHKKTEAMISARFNFEEGVAPRDADKSIHAATGPPPSNAFVIKPKKVSKPWMNDECRTAMKLREKAYDKWKKSQKPELKEAYLKIRNECTKTIRDTKRNFEEGLNLIGIKRPYFHVKPLERGQLKNWREYLDYEISQGDEDRIRILFERCLIAAAMYEEFWLKYIRYAESSERFTADDIRVIYDRAVNVHLSKRPGIHLQWAAFEEKHGKDDRAAEILDKAISQFSNLEILLLRRINLERRRGNLVDALAKYKHAIATSGSVSMASNLSIRAARFAAKIFDNAEEAGSILVAAIEKDPSNPRLYLQHIDFTLQRSPVDVDSAIASLNRAITAPLELQQRVRFAQRKLEFMEDFAASMKQIHEAEKEYSDLSKEARDKAPKREAEVTPKIEPEPKKAREAHSHSSQSTGSYPSAQTPGYGGSYPAQYNSYGASYGAAGYTGGAYTGTYPQQGAWYGQGNYGYGYGSYPYGGY